MSECEGKAAGEPAGSMLFVTSAKRSLLLKGLLHNPEGLPDERNAFSLFLILLVGKQPDPHSLDIAVARTRPHRLLPH